MHLKDIKIVNRGRKDFGDIFKLSESLKTYGLIQPVVVDENNSLIAGERRCRAAILAGWSEITTVCMKDLTDGQKKEIEIEENIQRKELHWTEMVSLKLQLDEIKRKQHGSAPRGMHYDAAKWSIEDTARQLDQSIGTTHQDLELARAVKADPKLGLKLSKYPKSVAYKRFKMDQEKKKLEKLHIEGTFDIKFGDARVLINELEDNSIDLVLTDPPFGIANILDSEGTYIDRAAETDNWTQEEVEKLLSTFLYHMFFKMKPSAHFYIFHGPELYPFLIKTLTALGFYIDPVPLIWYKGLTTTPFKGLSFMQCYEPILFGCKPPRSKYLTKAVRNFFEFKSISSNKKIHIFQKPPELLELLIGLSSSVGDTVLDPFAGSGQTIKTARDMKRKGLGFEIDKGNYHRAVKYLS